MKIINKLVDNCSNMEKIITSIMSRNMKKSRFQYLTLFFCIFTATTSIISQDNKNNDLSYTSRDIKKSLKTGLQYYQEANYLSAIPYLEKATSFYTNNSEAIYSLAECYYFEDKYFQAIKYFERARELKYEDTENLEIYLADAYHKNYQYSDAISLYNSILTRTSNSVNKKDFELNIQQCKNGVELSIDTTTLRIKNLGDRINSRYSDYAYFQLSDTNLIVLTSKRENCIGNQINPYDGQYYEDIYFSKIQKDNNSQIINAGNKINTADPDACIGVSKNKKRIYIYKSDNQGDIEELEYVKNKWQFTKNVDFINSIYQETSISLTKDNIYIYFVSDREGSLGGKDIFMIEKNGENSYLSTVNLGDNINTKYNEEAVYINNTNDTLYFSSEGHSSIGGYDIFRSTKDSMGNWQKPENMGFPYNSTNDDLYFFPSDTCSYLSSLRENSIGKSDIYVVYGKKDNSIEKLTKGTSNIQINIRDTSLIQIAVIDSFPKHNIEVLKKYIKSIKIEFAYNGSSLQDIYKISLDSVAEIMANHKDFILPITGHTDNLGTVEYNSKLSIKRAKTVANYLINNGVPSTQIIYSGKSSKQPAASNKTEIGRAKNRRVEFDIK